MQSCLALLPLLFAAPWAEALEDGAKQRHAVVRRELPSDGLMDGGSMPSAPFAVGQGRDPGAGGTARSDEAKAGDTGSGDLRSAEEEVAQHAPAPRPAGLCGGRYLFSVTNPLGQHAAQETRGGSGKYVFRNSASYGPALGAQCEAADYVESAGADQALKCDAEAGLQQAWKEPWMYELSLGLRSSFSPSPR